MNQDEIREPIIRLIVDNNESKVGPAIGIPAARERQIKEEVWNIYKDHETISKRMQVITETYYHPAELACALFSLGEIATKASCPLHNGGGLLGLIIGGFKPTDDGDDDNDNNDNR
jgi:hypothetical protein